MISNYTFEELNSFLDSKVNTYNNKDFINTDPIQFPHKYSNKQDIEISAFLTATITWGKRALIIESAKDMHEKMGSSPYDYIMGKGYERLGESNIHRTFFEHDMAYMCRGLHAIYNKYDDLELLFKSHLPANDRIWNSILVFRNYMIYANGEISCRSLKHISNPVKSACKRLHLALKWLVRNDGIVDLGLWKSISPAELQMPLDVHVTNIGRELGLLVRKQNDRKAVEELTTELRKYNPNDPTIYDFALFGIGEERSREK